MSVSVNDIPALLRTLSSDATDRNLSSQQRAEFLERLKILGRTANPTSPLFDKEGIKTLCLHGFTLNHDEPKAELEALRCLANCLLLAPKTRATLIDVGFASTPAEQLQDVSTDKEFVLSRIIFYETYEPSYPLEKVVTENDLDGRIEKLLQRHAARYPLNPKAPVNGMDEMALVETLKLVFNISHHLKKKELFTSSLSHILKMINLHPLDGYPVNSTISPMVNCLLNIDLTESKDMLFPSDEPTRLPRRLVDLLDKALDPKATRDDASGPNFLDAVVSPLIELLRILFSLSPDGVALDMKRLLLPADEDRSKPLGTGTALPARLIRLSNAPSSAKAQQCAGDLLYTLSSSNPEEFVRNVGYGYASGYLVNNKIAVPTEALAGEGSETGNKPINPITGQTRESEPELPDPFAGMTDEEKEREAERLFVLFERLKKTGVIDVVNPVRQAVEEGRFEELDDDGKPRRK